MAGRGYKFPDPEDKHTFNFWMKKSHYVELQELAGFESRSVADIVRELIAEHLRDKSEADKARRRRPTRRKAR